MERCHSLRGRRFRSVRCSALLIALLHPLEAPPEERDVEVDDAATPLADDALFKQPSLVLRGIAARGLEAAAEDRQEERPLRSVLPHPASAFTAMLLPGTTDVTMLPSLATMMFRTLPALRSRIPLHVRQFAA